MSVTVTTMSRDCWGKLPFHYPKRKIARKLKCDILTPVSFRKMGYHRVELSLLAVLASTFSIRCQEVSCWEVAVIGEFRCRMLKKNDPIV
ncbi:hypothetical protein CEXT_125721 [Caerostris extrusa]|uniref:Uncharacterized protein n=1 Tax=Caerostris extrusa TaxID=172846 RepID=A0AAV4MBD4_CAEEX|nr:hypothetical protein CEXT_125721 [Caerostris extrusa]